VPCGENSEKMPIGLQLIANHFNEATLFNIANFFENNFNKEAK
jgi:Asp-tRNA(Asn)/Glu-tRNA(Gln) amidotransferase A subunit family amidase